MNNIQNGGIFFLDVSDLMVILFIVSLSGKFMFKDDINTTVSKENIKSYNVIIDEKSYKPYTLKNLKNELLESLNKSNDEDIKFLYDKINDYLKINK